MEALYFSIIGLHVAPVFTLLWMLLTRHKWFSVIAATWLSGFLGVAIAFTHFGPQSWLPIAANVIVSALASGVAVWLNKILWEEWDPIGVNATGIPDEYQSYADYLAQLCGRGTTVAVIFELLRYFRTQLMMLAEDNEADCRIAEKILHC